MTEAEQIKAAAIAFLKAYYDPRQEAAPFFPKLKALERAVEFDARTWGVRLETGEWTYE